MAISTLFLLLYPRLGFGRFSREREPAKAAREMVSIPRLGFGRFSRSLCPMCGLPSGVMLARSEAVRRSPVGAVETRPRPTACPILAWAVARVNRRITECYSELRKLIAQPVDMIT